MQSDYDAITRSGEPTGCPISHIRLGKQALLAWLSGHQKTVLTSVFCLFLGSYVLVLTSSSRHLSMSSLALLTVLCSGLLALGYVNFGKTLPRLKPKTHLWRVGGFQVDFISRTDFTIQSWSKLFDCGLAVLAERFAGRLSVSLPDDALAWVNMSAFYSILEALIERALTQPQVSIRIAFEQDYASLSYRCLALEIFGAEQAELDIETLFAPVDSRLPSEQHFLYARQFMQQAGGKLLYKSDLRKERKITFLFPKVE